MKIFHILRHTLSLYLLLQLSALSFGQNKVQYTDFSWNKLHSQHFNIYYHQNQGVLPKVSFRWIENAYLQLSRDLQYSHKSSLPLILYGDPNLFTQTNVITEVLPEGVGGFTELFKNRIVVPFNGSYAELRHVLHHELVHAFTYSILLEQFGSRLLMDASVQVPLWFMEGLAEYHSSKWDVEADMFLMDQAINGSIPLPGVELNGYMAYKGGQSFLLFLASSRGDSAFLKFLREFKKSKSVDNCLKAVYKKTTEELGKEWIQELKKNYWPEIGKRESPALNAQAITSHLESRDNFNLRPRLSPDGTRIAFFSDKRDYTRILVTDLKGKVLHEISQTGYGGYFETFHPFRSGLSWSPDGNRIAFVTKSAGNDELRIVDIKKRKLQKRIPFKLTSISSPDWSRDGSKLVFTGITDGFSDIYTYNLQTDTLQRITRDILYESDPKFIDNNEIFYSTQDTSGTATDHHLPYGPAPSDLEKLNLATGNKVRLTSTPWNEKQCAVSPDGKHAVFVSDRNGIDNLYIGNLDSLLDAKPVTDYIGGCSNPDWSQKSDKLVFTLFQQSGWDVWLMDKPEIKIKKDTLSITRLVESSRDSTKRLFSFTPIPEDSTVEIKERQAKAKAQVKQRDTSISEELVEIRDKTDSTEQKQTDSLTVNPIDTTRSDSIQSNASLLKDSMNLTSDSASNRLPVSNVKGDSSVGSVIPSPEPYRLVFSPDIAAVGLGVNTFYGYAGQWMLSFSDLMGDHRITLSGDVQGNLKDYIHLFASYLYLKHRIDFGVGGYFSRDYTYASVFGDLIYHDTDFGGFFFAQYPFSLFSRLDFQLFGRQIQRDPVDTSLPTVSSTALLPSLSYVYDNTLWGITGPVNGIRATATAMVSPPFDFIEDHFISFDADVRMYFHLMKRFVWANRLYLGASMALDGSSSARRYFLGGNDNWLFYHVNIDEYERNISKSFYSDFVTPFRGWNYIDISGSRVALLNSEFRFPFIREISVVWPLPMRIQYINGALFTDVGNAWNGGERHNGLPLPDKLYGGFGFGLRANLGVFILRYDRGWPTDWRAFVGAPTNYFSLGSEF